MGFRKAAANIKSVHFRKGFIFKGADENDLCACGGQSLKVFRIVKLKRGIPDDTDGCPPGVRSLFFSRVFNTKRCCFHISARCVHWFLYFQSRFSGKFQYRLEVKIIIGNFCRRIDGIPGPFVFMGGYKPHVPFGKGLAAQFGYGTQNRYPAVLLNTLS